MSTSSAIEWTESTWNPVTGCSKVSPGCAHCYAETVALRFWAMQYPQTQSYNQARETVFTPRRFDDVLYHEDRLDQPLRWQKPRRIFVNSMSDLFHEAVPDTFIDKVFAVMALAPRHIFQVLTKRAARMHAYVSALGRSSQRLEEAALELGYTLRWNGISLCPWPLPNVWLGVSVENQHFADERVPLLLQTPATIRFISAEPLLEKIDLTNFLWSRPGARLNRLHWIIVGGESGHGARPFHVEWARWLISQGTSADVPVFVKQLGALTRFDRDETVPFIRNRKGGDPAEWPADLRVREFPRSAGVRV